MVNNNATAHNLNTFEAENKKIDDKTLKQFQHLLRSVLWKSVYENNNINNKFNLFSLLF
jgi:hypothetical protein